MQQARRRAGLASGRTPNETLTDQKYHMRVFRVILFSVLVVFVLIQFIRPARNRSSQTFPHDITNLYAVPQDVQTILKDACYDCHSNNTRYPWYVDIQPVGWLLAKHVRDGKEELNFNEYGFYSSKRHTIVRSAPCGYQ